MDSVNIEPLPVEDTIIKQEDNIEIPKSDTPPTVVAPVSQMEAIRPPVRPRPKKIFRPVYSKLRTKAKCHICGHYFKRSCLGRHVKYVHGEMVVQCTICKRCFNRPDSARHHVTLHHKIDSVRSKEFLCDVKKRDLPEEEVPPLRRRGQADFTEVLPTVKAFNCFDCDSTYNNINDLFNHCEVHRYSENGKKYSTLVPLRLKLNRNPTK